jgi:hypothetical protein
MAQRFAGWAGRRNAASYAFFGVFLPAISRNGGNKRHETSILSPLF